jgi:hypothetical protein
VLHATERTTQAQLCDLLVVVALLLSAHAAQSSEPEPPKRNQSDREIADIILNKAHAVRPLKIPLECDVDFDLLNLIRIDEAKETYTIDFYFWVEWQDDRLKFEPNGFGADPKGVVIPPSAAWDNDRLWNPIIEFMNLVDAKTTEQYLRLRPEGRCRYTARQTSTFKFAGEENAFKRFPFDQQDLKIKVGSFRWDRDSVIFRIKDPDVATQQEQIKKLSTAEWRILRIHTGEAATPFKGDEKPFSEASVIITVKRQAGFYLWRICLPLVVLVFIAMSVVWIPRDHPEARMILSVTTLVAVTTFSIVVNADLPRLPYLTLMDVWMLVSFILTAGGAIQNVIVTSIEHHKKEGLAHKIDSLCRWVVPLLYLGSTGICILLYLIPMRCEK